MAVLVALVAGCATVPPSPTSTGPDGSVVVDIVEDPGLPSPFFEPIHRAQLIAGDGSIAAAWQVLSSAVPVSVPPGTYGLQVFTVFLGDTLECVTDPAAPGGSRCGQPTLGPGQVCSHDVVVVADRRTPATFHVRPEGACVLEVGEPAAT